MGQAAFFALIGQSPNETAGHDYVGLNVVSISVAFIAPPNLP